MLTYSELVALLKRGGTLPRFHAVVLDEAVRVKESAAQVTQAVRQVQAGHWLALTGTPQKNRLRDLFALCQLVLSQSGGTWLYPPRFHETARFDTYFHVTEDHLGTCQPTGLFELWRAFASVIVRRRKLDVPGLVRKIEHRIGVTMDAAQAAHYHYLPANLANLNCRRLAAI